VAKTGGRVFLIGRLDQVGWSWICTTKGNEKCVPKSWEQEIDDYHWPNVYMPDIGRACLCAVLIRSFKQFCSEGVAMLPILYMGKLRWERISFPRQ
jgi:hypothetical protein